MEHATLKYIISSQIAPVLAGSVLVALGGCASKPTPELVDARDAYARAEESPAPRRHPAEMERAKVALDRAEAAHDEDPGSKREARLAERAERRAEVAVARSEEPLEARREDTTARDNAERAGLQRSDAEMEARIERERVRERERDENAARVRANAKVNEPADARVKPAVVEAAPVARSKAATKDEDRKAIAALQNLGSVASVKEEPRGVVITLSGELLFPTGQKEMSPVARQSLDQVAHALAEQPASTTFDVAGHTDNSGATKQNQQLSTQRAQAVADYLIDSGIDRSRVRAVGKGESAPIASNDTAEGRALNRRVEIVATRQGRERADRQQ